MPIKHSPPISLPRDPDFEARFVASAKEKLRDLALHWSVATPGEEMGSMVADVLSALLIATQKPQALATLHKAARRVHKKRKSDVQTRPIRDLIRQVADLTKTVDRDAWPGALATVACLFAIQYTTTTERDLTGDWARGIAKKLSDLLARRGVIDAELLAEHALTAIGLPRHVARERVKSATRRTR